MSTHSRIHMFFRDIDLIEGNNDGGYNRVSLNTGIEHDVTVGGTPAELRQLGETIVFLADQLAAGRKVELRPPFELTAADDVARQMDEELAESIRAATAGEVANLTLDDVVEHAGKLGSA